MPILSQPEFFLFFKLEESKILDFLDGLGGKKNLPQCGRPWFNPWVVKIPWRRKWQYIPVFLPGKSYGQRSLAGYNPLGHKGSDMTE